MCKNPTFMVRFQTFGGQCISSSLSFLSLFLASCRSAAETETHTQADRGVLCETVDVCLMDDLSCIIIRQNI